MDTGRPAMTARVTAIAVGLWLVVAWSASGAGEQARVEKIRAAAWEDRFRIVVDLSRSAEFDEQTATEPDRIVLDMDAAAASGLKAPVVKDALVRAIRIEQREGARARLVVNLARATAHKVFTLPPEQNRPFRIVCDVLRSGGPAPPPPPRDWVVVLDPGHGGRDPGAINSKIGLREEEIALDVALRLKRQLASGDRVKVVLTRESGKGLRLGERVRRAEEAEGDIFVSIHVNGCPNQSARGAEVFFLSLQGATNAEAHAVAELENAADTEDLPVPDEIARLPFGGDLIQTATHQRSSKLAEVVLEALGASRLAATRGVKQANFVVLRSYRVPSVLVELGFISNPADARQLGSAEHRQALAETIAKGLLAYRDRYATAISG